MLMGTDNSKHGIVPVIFPYVSLICTDVDIVNANFYSLSFLTRTFLGSLASALEVFTLDLILRGSTVFFLDNWEHSSSGWIV